MLLHACRARWCARLLSLVVCCAGLLLSQASAQYSASFLDSNVPIAAHQDLNLVDGWGLTAFPSSPFWVSNQNTSTSTLFTGDGTIVPLVVQIPCVSKGAPTVPCPVPGVFPLVPPFGPTGAVANLYAGAEAFRLEQKGVNVPALFIFDTLDGLIVGWNPTLNLTQALVATRDRIGSAIYTGLAIWGPANDPHLYAANSIDGIDVFDRRFRLVNTFHADSNPGPYTPYGIQTIGNTLYVTYANPSVQGGIVDACDLTTSNTMPMCRRLAAATESPFWINAPWGLALAPSNFGPLSGSLLVGNLGSGQIVALNPATGQFKAWLRLKNGDRFTVSGLWALEFGGGAAVNGNTNQLFFTAGPAGKNNVIFSTGLFGVINPPK
ncbi:MAG TPA: TIGR03118 family protein [Terriglobales bacterium]